MSIESTQNHSSHENNLRIFAAKKQDPQLEFRTCVPHQMVTTKPHSA